MGTMTGTQISAAVRILCSDNGATKRYEDDVHLVWLNDAVRALCAFHPEESSTLLTIELDDGPWQTLPASVQRMLKPVRNMGADGATPGSLVFFCSPETLDRLDPGWHVGTPAQVVQNVLYDPSLDARRFLVYPPSPGGYYIQALCATMPTEMAALSETIHVSDRYANALQAYMMFRYFSTDAEDASNAQAAEAYYKLFTAEAA